MCIEMPKIKWGFNDEELKQHNKAVEALIEVCRERKLSFKVAKEALRTSQSIVERIAQSRTF